MKIFFLLFFLSLLSFITPNQQVLFDPMITKTLDKIKVAVTLIKTAKNIANKVLDTVKNIAKNVLGTTKLATQIVFESAKNTTKNVFNNKKDKFLCWFK